jgi:type VI secretion system protein VasJ
VEKLQSLTGEPVNWGNVASLSAELLETKSKDFRLICYNAAARLQQGTAQEVLDAVVLLLEFSKAFWETAHPPLKRIRARAGILGWMAEQSAKVRDIKLTTKDGDVVAALDQVTGELESDLRDKFADAYPGLGDLREGVRHLARTVPKEKPPAPPPAAPTAAAPAGGAPAAAGATPAPVAARLIEAPSQPVSLGALNDVGQVEHVLPAAGQLLSKMGALLRAQKPENPLAYRLARMGMWLDLNEMPAVVDGKTLVPPPPDGLKSRFDSLLAANDLLTLINEAEDTASEFILWLDPHRYVAAAMDRMGALFLRAKEALVTETAIMLRRVPMLPTLQYSSGDPFADGQTRMWLDAEVASALGGGGGGPATAAEPSVLDEPIKEARDLAVKGKLAEAVALVAKAADGAPTPVDRFRGQLAVAQLCLQAGQFAVVRAQLLGLGEDVERRGLRAWQPRLCAELYATLYAAFRGLYPNAEEIPPEERARQNHTFEQLCQLDPAQALKLVEAK